MESRLVGLGNELRKARVEQRCATDGGPYHGGHSLEGGASPSSTKAFDGFLRAFEGRIFVEAAQVRERKY